MTFIRPRLIDHYDLPFTQEQLDFVIPFIDEDIPLYLDPFLLWKSPSMQDNSLHTAIVNSFNQIGYLIRKDRETEASEILIRASECNEVGLGLSATRRGHRIGGGTAQDIITVFKQIPEIHKAGFIHFEEIQLYVDNISKDRISDIACNFLKSFLIDYTIQQADELTIPMTKTIIQDFYDYKTNKFKEVETFIPQNPVNHEPIIFVPKRWLRFVPWINYEDYFENCFNKGSIEGNPSRIQILNYNRENYGVVRAYIESREEIAFNCKNDSLFKQIPILTAKRKLRLIQSLPTGKEDNADKKYEDYLGQIMTSVLFPHLDFAKDQSRTDSGVLIRDLIFYNNRSFDFLNDIYDDYNCRQIVMEIKNVKTIEREHINQLNRYLNNQFGSFGIIVTRNPLPKSMFKNTIDLWSGQRKCIIALNDQDLELMVSLYESKQRQPIEVIKRSYINFTRSCPS